MSENVKTSNEEVGSEKKTKRDKSAGYPSTSLDRAIEAIQAVNEKLGQGPYDRGSVATALGFSGISGASSSLVGTLTHFGLLERTGANTYSRSELAKRILTPLDENEKAQSIMEALHRPRLYAALLEKYKGQALPSMLANLLNRLYDISESAAGRAEQVFRDSCEYAGVLKNGILLSEPTTQQGGGIEATSLTTANTPSAKNKNDFGGFGEFYPSLLDSNKFDLPVGVKLVVPDRLMSAFAFGEFGKEVKDLSKKLEEWERNNPVIE